MDNEHLHLLSRNNALFLPSDSTAPWEIDDVELSEPVLLAETNGPVSAEQSDGQRLAAGVSRERFTETPAPLWKLLDSTAGVQHEADLSDPQSSFRTPMRPVDWFSNTHHGRPSGIGPQPSATETRMPVRSIQQEKGKSPRTCSLAPLVPPRTPPSETSFMELYSGDATLSYLADNGEAKLITGLSVQAIQQSCPLLAAAFEHRSSGPQLHLEILNDATALPFLRYLYTGSYALNGESGDVYEDAPTSLLLHCQLYYLGHTYGLRPLLQQANVNIIRQCEFGCSSPDKPIHLTPAIKYAYAHLSNHAGVLDTIISYCVSCFLRHRLAEDEEFKQIAYNLKPFHQALCQESMNRKFENETASAIIRMPFKRDTPDFYLSREDLAPLHIGDVVHHFHGGDAFDSNRSARADIKGKGVEGQRPSLAFRTLSALNAFQQRRETYQVCPERPEESNAQRRTEEAKASRSESPPPCERPGRSRTPFRRQSPSRAVFVFPDRRPLRDGHVHRLSVDDPDSDESENSAPPSDSEYEVVQRRVSVKSLSSESEAGPELPDQVSMTRIAATLPIRGLNFESSAALSGPSGSFDGGSESSDSEWSLV